MIDNPKSEDDFFNNMKELKQELEYSRSFINHCKKVLIDEETNLIGLKLSLERNKDALRRWLNANEKEDNSERDKITSRFREVFPELMEKL